MAATIASLPAPSTVAGYGGGTPDPNGTPQASPGGQSSAINLTAAAVIKASPGRVCRISVINIGSGSGAFTLNDCTTVAAAATANQIWTQAYNASLAANGQVIQLDFPCINGIVLSAVPGGGSPQLAVSFN